MSELDYDNPIEVVPGVFWVGFYDKEADLQCNPYLIVDGREAVLIDPGSIPHFAVVMRKVIDVVNPISISAIVINNQDPDVCGNLAVVESIIERKDLKVVMHSSNSRLIRHYGVTSNFYHADEHGYRLTLASGRELEFIYMPFLHSPFALMTYDRGTGTLFSGDLFGAVSMDWGLFADGGVNRDALEAWHRVTMPNNQVLRAGMERLKNYDIKNVLSQHGSVLRGENVLKVIEILQELKCGTDLA